VDTQVHAAGTDHPGDGVDAGRLTQPEPAGRPGRPGRTLALWGGAAALVLVAGGVATGTVNATVYSPEAQVERYLDALAEGDGAAALGLAGGGPGSGDAGPAPGTATTLLDGAPLAAGFSALQDVTVSRAGESGDGVEVAVGYRVDGRDRSTTFVVERVGRDWLFFDRWRMAPVPLSTVRVAPGVWPAEAAGQHLAGSVNGVEVTLTGESSPAQDFAVLPPLAVEGSATSTYLEAAPARTVVDGADPSRPLPLALDLQYTDEVATAANRQLDEYLARCTGQQVLNPAGCPMGYETLNRIPPESISWSVAPDPTLEIAPLPGGEGGAGGGDDGAGSETGDGTAGTPQGTDVTVAAPVRTGARLSLEEIDLVTGERRRVDHQEPIVVEADLQVGPESVRYAPQAP
jgi:hypothetical protein